MTGIHKLNHSNSTDCPDYGRTFPMYVPAIDWYFLTDDSPDYPMAFYLDLDFSGTLDQEKMSEALREALFRHPLLFSVIQVAKKDRLCWIPDFGQLPEIDWADEGVPMEFQDHGYIDIQKNPGLRVWVRQGESTARMTMQFHHSACDGTGAYRFLGDLLACYMSRLDCCEGKVELADFDPGQLKIRASKMRSIRTGDSPIKKLALAIREGWQHVGTKVTPLTPPKQSPQSQTLPGMVKREFSQETLTNVRNVATADGGTLNDYFLCKMFQAACDWNGLPSGGKKIRILVPADMRDGQDFEMPACNMTACTFITRNANEIADEKRLMDLVRQDTLKIKAGDLQKSFVNAITTAMEGSMLPKIMNKNKCLATCVLSNAGDPARRFTCRIPKKRGKVSCDEFTLESISGVPPLRRHTRSTLSVSIYGRKLTFSLRCDPHLFSMEDSDRLLNTFCDQMSDHLG